MNEKEKQTLGVFLLIAGLALVIFVGCVVWQNDMNVKRWIIAVIGLGMGFGIANMGESMFTGEKKDS